MATAFPRGKEVVPLGVDSLKTRNKKHKRDEDILFTSVGVDSTRDNDNTSNNSNTNKRERGKKKHKPEKKWSEMKRSGKLAAAKELTAGDGPSKALVLSYSAIEEGMSIIGTVKSIEPLKVQIQLPYNLIGYISITEISDSLTAELQKYGPEVTPPSLSNFFTVGQWVSTVVISVSAPPKKIIQLTTRETILNRSIDKVGITKKSLIYGSIQSIEDHGYVVNLGVTGTTAFLPFKNSQKWKPRKENDNKNSNENSKDNSNNKDNDNDKMEVDENKEEQDKSEKEDNDVVMEDSENNNNNKKKDNKKKKQDKNKNKNNANSNDKNKDNNDDKNKDEDKDDPLMSVGQPIHALVADVKAQSSLFTLNCNFEQTVKTKVKSAALLTFESLRAGMLVDGRVSEIFTNGIMITFFSLFNGTVDIYHLDKLRAYEELKDIREGDKLVSRVLFVNYITKQVGLTLQPIAKAYRPTSFSVTKSQILEAEKFPMTVKRIDYGVGMAVECSATGECGYVHLYRMSDSPVEKISELFSVNYKIPRARVLGLNYTEQVIQLTLKPSDLEKPFLSYDDVLPGHKVPCTITAVLADCLKVKVSDSLWGIITQHHLSDIAISDISTRFKEGQKITCRVLHVKNRWIHLTAKKTLVNSDHEIITSSHVRNGTLGHGTVLGLRDNGIIVLFYNNTPGFVPLLELGVGSAEPKKHFILGQPVLCRVISQGQHQGELRCSLRMPQVLTEREREELNLLLNSVKMGSIVQAKVIATFNNGLEVEFSIEEIPLEPKDNKTDKDNNNNADNNNTDKKKKKKNKKKDEKNEKKYLLVKGFIPLAHLSDHREHCEDILQKLSIGTILPEVMILKKSNKKREFSAKVVLTMKPSLINATKTGNFPKEATEEIVGKSYFGYIKKFLPYGIIVQCAKVAGLAHMSRIAHTHIENLSENFFVGQTVLAAVTKIVPDVRIVDINLKPRGAYVEAEDQDGYGLVSFLRERQKLEKAKKKVKNWNKYKIGQVVPGVVTAVEEVGVLVKFADEPELTGFATATNIGTTQSEQQQQQQQQIQKLSYSVDDTVQCYILDIDKQKGIIDISLRKELTTAITTATTTATTTANTIELKEGMTVTATVQLVQTNYVVLILSEEYILPQQQQQQRQQQSPQSLLRRRIPVFMRSTGYNDVGYANPFKKYTVSQTITVIIKKIPELSEIPQKFPENEWRLPGLDRIVVTEKPPPPKPKLVRPPRSPSNSKIINTISELKIGHDIPCTVRDIYKLNMIVLIGGHVKARVHVTEVNDNDNNNIVGVVSEENGKTALRKKTGGPFDQFQIGQSLPKCRIISITTVDTVDTKILPFSHPKKKFIKNLVDVSLRPALLSTPEGSLEPQRPTWKSLEKGQILPGWVHEITPEGLWVHLSSTVRGRVFVLDISNDIQILRNFGSHYQPGKFVKVSVLRVDADKQELDLSIKAVNPAPNTASIPQEIRADMVIPGRVARVTLANSVVVQLFSHTYGRAYLTDIYDVYKENPVNDFVAKVGHILPCYVLKVDNDVITTNNSNNNNNHPQIDVSLRPSRVGIAKDDEEVINEAKAKEQYYPEVKAHSDIKANQLVQGYITSNDGKTVFVALSRTVAARVFVSNLSDRFVKNPKKRFPVGKLVTGRITKVDYENTDERENPRIEMTLKKSQTSYRHISYDELTPGMKLNGKVKSITEFGIFVVISQCGACGLVHKTQIANEEFADAKAIRQHYSKGDRVKVMLIKKNPAKKQLTLSMKPEHFVGDMDNNSEDEDDDSDDDKDNENDSNNEDVDDKEEKLVVDNDNNKHQAGEEEGDDDDMSLVPKVSQNDNQKSSKVKKRQREEQQQQEEGESEEQQSRQKKRQKQEGKAEQQQQQDDNNNNKKKGKRKADEVTTITENKNKKQKKEQEEQEEGEEEGTATKVAISVDNIGGLDWSKPQQQNDDSSSDNDDFDDDNNDNTNNNSNKKKEVKGKQPIPVTPLSQHTPEYFERQILSQPQASITWIHYMAFYIGKTNLEKAREIARRGLARIDPSNEEEKLAIWLAWINMEYTYSGSDSEEFQKVLSEAIQYNHPKKVYLHLIKVYKRDNNDDSIVSTFKTLISKYKTHKSVWIHNGIYLYRSGQATEARKLLKRSLESLPNRKHNSIICKFAQLEYQFGSTEIGATLFEDLISEYPKKIDIHTMFIDQETKIYGNTQNAEKIRNLYDRVTSLNLSSKKMKHLLKRWLKFEQSVGEEDKIEFVKEKAKKYIEKKEAKKEVSEQQEDEE